ncbi:MAG: hypothetical protein ACP5MB_04990 [bacterium]
MSVSKLKDQRGFSVMDLMVWAGVVVVLLGIIGTAAVFFNRWKVKEEYANEFKMIESGLAAYFQSTYKYPPSGWSWDTNGAYVPQRVVNKGWQYQCSNNQITITTPPITQTQVFSQIYNTFQARCDSASQNGSSLTCTLYNKPCS